MNIRRTVTGSNPITLAEAKLFLRANDYDTDDLLIASLITSAVYQAEKFCNRAFVVQTIEYHERFDAGDIELVTEMRLPYPNHLSVTEVKVNGAVTTDYTVSGLNHFIVSLQGLTLGSDGRTAEAIVKYSAGDCSEAEKVALKNIIKEMYDNRSDGPLNENAFVYLLPFRCYY